MTDTADKHSAPVKTCPITGVQNRPTVYDYAKDFMPRKDLSLPPPLGFISRDVAQAETAAAVERAVLAERARCAEIENLVKDLGGIVRRIDGNEAHIMMPHLWPKLCEVARITTPPDAGQT